MKQKLLTLFICIILAISLSACDSDKSISEITSFTPNNENPIEIEPFYEESVDNSRTVYTTPYGKKYHYSRSCAGINAIPTTKTSAEQSYGPCKKCAH